ncbi:Meiotic recombination protein DMC1/LIM15-like [Porphyridium purpureum]|uniref:Meiotic recombination protein DMC1/LIM15-like n=1 Tax=Porphyridium purpureum TaxID=35688 RepID=A0A5J4Z6X5_PORPP|nr:Meiotic recombination protein DMC1/LIM15-like [Porphyridium purpureum]|eukprot:POR7791..scf295_1
MSTVLGHQEESMASAATGRIRRKRSQVEPSVADMNTENDAEGQEDEQAEDRDSYVAHEIEEIDKLTELGIGAAEVKKYALRARTLKDAGFYTVMSVMMCMRKTLLCVKGLSEAKVDKIRDCCGKLVQTDFISGTQCREKRKGVYYISTGSSALDSIIGGGIESASITEAFGEFRCGKTQLSHTLCVTAQLPREAGGGNGKVAFIDTENTFRPERIAAMCDRFELHEDDVLDNIHVARAYSSEHQIELLTHVAARMAYDQYALLIVDSATALFRTDYTGRGELADRQQKLNRFMASLMKIAEQFNVAVFITNQVMATPDGAMSFQADPKKPIGGHVMAHASTTRLSLRKGRGEQRIAKIFDSPMYGENEATFEIAEEGIIDPKD